MVEQDHRGVKRVTRPMLGFESFEAAQDTLVGIQLMHMLKKGQMVGKRGEDRPHTRPNVLHAGRVISIQTGATAPSRPPKQNLRHNLRIFRKVGVKGN